MVRRWLPFLLSSLFLLAAAPQVQAQTAGGGTGCDHPAISCCGDLEILFLNPDLQPGSDGIIRASGALFAQFQVIGDTADQVDKLGFSFGVDTGTGIDTFDESFCQDTQFYYTGQEIQFYRFDGNPDDGFFINLQTGLVPDGAYQAALHALDADDNELARFWARAVVNNCDVPGPLPAGPVERCDGDEEQMTRNDGTMPWPIVLPGDGQLLPGVTGFSLEFAEPLSDLVVTLNGEDITEDLEEWEGRLWDDDLIPGYGPGGSIDQLFSECTTPPLHECNHLGVAYQWNERALNDDDVLRVEGTDLNGNLATKDLHIGSGVTGGAISAQIPILEWQVDVASHELEPGQEGAFTFIIRNSGAVTGHPFADQTVPAGWDYSWDPVHTPVQSGSSESQTFIVKAPSNATAGVYDIQARMNYQAAGEDKTLNQPLKIVILEPAGGPVVDPNETPDEGTKDSPAPAALLVLGLLAAAVVLRRRN